MNWRDRIEISPKTLVGKPIVKGTRISVKLVLEMKGEGISDADILDNYPRLELADIWACMAYVTAGR